MMKSLHSLCALFLLSSLSLQAQADIKIPRSDFRNEREGFRKAWKHVKAGDSYYVVKGIYYGSAYDEYLRATAYNSVNPELNYKTGVSALFSDNKEEAAGFLVKAAELDSSLTRDILLLAGRALQYAGRFSAAVEMLNDYLSLKGKKPKESIAAAKKYLEECISAIEITKDTLRIEIRNAGSNINSFADDYSQLLSSDGETMYFASRRQLSKSSTRYDDSRYDENIYVSSLAGGSWTFPVTPGKNLVTDLCETPLYLSPTGDKLFIYAGYENGGDIMVSERKRGKWRSPSAIPFKINTKGSETSFTFSPSGDEIWFVTDNGKDALGGKDIYYISKLNDRKWSKPVNAGPAINTPYDEESVRFSVKGDTLWFASRGHTTIGGFDIFYSVKNENGEWRKAVNSGYPLNTPWDELFFHPAQGNNKLFYFVSNRSEGMGGLDIYSGRILPPEPVIIPVEPPKPDTVILRDTVVIVKEIIPVPEPEPVLPEPPREKILYLIGTVTDSETGEPVFAKIDVIDLDTDLVTGTTASSDADGTYRIKLPEKKSYMIDLRAAGFLSDMKRVNIPTTYAEEVYKLDATLIRVKVGKKVVLNNILFETGKAILTTGSYSELDRLAGILEDNPLMRIEISGHTDNTGSIDLNNRLSQNRAQAVVEYLVVKGINRERLEFKGYGPSQPIADNTTAEGRKVNRRVEFKILEF